jgi:acyl carrier protein
MSNLDVIEKVNSLLIEEFEIEQSDISVDAPLKDVLQLDSLDYVDLVVMLEGNFGFKVKQEDFATIKSFSNLYDYVLAKIPQSVKS